MPASEDCCEHSVRLCETKRAVPGAEPNRHSAGQGGGGSSSSSDRLEVVVAAD